METAAAPGIRIDLDDLIGLRLRAQSLRLARTQRAQRPLAGGHESRLRGRGMEFAESRAYLPGDDIRAMDWRVTARTGRAHTKVFQEERERPVVIVVDLGPGMYFGSRRVFKSVAAAQIAALVAWVSASRGDRVGGLVFAGPEHRELRPAGGRRGVLKLLRALIEMDGRADPATGAAPASVSASGAAMAAAVLRARRIARPGSLSIVISDFYGMDPETGHEAERHLKRLREHGDVRLAWVQDPLEMDAPPPGRYAVSDGERIASLDASARTVQIIYREYFETRRAELEQMCLRSRIPLTLISSAEEPMKVTRDLLGDRRA
ncbi:MAG: DUF58 domain-containing protein [Gammaproteobacteria bacterium]